MVLEEKNEEILLKLDDVEIKQVDTFKCLGVKIQK